MKLEIDIPSIIYNDAKENRGYISVGKMEIAWKSIADGKPLEQELNKSENPTGSIEIKVGDEVTVAGANGIVVREPYPIGSDNELFVLVWYGQHLSSNSLKNVAPTGRHFSQITEVLEQLRRSYRGGLAE